MMFMAYGVMFFYLLCFITLIGLMTSPIFAVTTLKNFNIQLSSTQRLLVGIIPFFGLFICCLEPVYNPFLVIGAIITGICFIIQLLYSTRWF